jgi:Arc-like DNA binding dprotein
MIFRIYPSAILKANEIWHWGNMARVKKRTDTATNRESDKIIVRLPAGMRAYLTDMAGRRGRSVNAEVVTALASYIAHDGEVDTSTIKSALAEMKQEITLLRDALGLKIEQAERGRALMAEVEEVTAQARAFKKRAEAELGAASERRKQKSPPE